MNPESTAVSPTTRSRRGVPRRDSQRPADTRPEVPDHEILRKIGTGSYGEVWLARSVTGAYRAVKVVWREDFSDEQVFIREFDGILSYEPIARGIPGLVHILHIGQHGGQFPYYFYVMELADDAYTGSHTDPGSYIPRTLYSDMQQYGNRPMPLDYVLEVGCQLARALAGLHAQELTHRDVKLTNVIFINGRVKLADAGLVAHSNQRSFVGTEGYIPPEGPGTPRADVFALAKVLYEMSTGMDRLNFPTLPAKLPEGTNYRRWIEFNNIICAAADPQVHRHTIVNAIMMAEKLEALRDEASIRHKKRLTWRQRGIRAGIFLLCAGLLAGLTYLLLPEDMGDRLRNAADSLQGKPPAPAPPPPATTPEPPPPVLPQHGQYFVGSVPAGASVYTEDGIYLDETPYGPITAQAGKRVAFILRKEGYADTHTSGIIPPGNLLSLGGELLPYRPPRTGEDWTDAQGTHYRPAGGVHEATAPVTPAQFQEFLNADPGAAAKYPSAVSGGQLHTSQEGISAFTLWLTRQCEKAGTIGRDHSLIARPEPGTEAGPDLCGYRLYTVLVQKTPVSIYTNPAGASVSLNGMPLGITPMQGVRIPLAPYYLEIRLPGYSTVRRSGLSPQDLVLNLRLQPNHSVNFGAEWINSLGIKMQPIQPNLLACATEIRVEDYSNYCRHTGAPVPPPTSFDQNEHHPVVNITRAEAEAFAAWLTGQERANGLIEETDTYRLPTDEEWSNMVGCKDAAGESPYERQRHRATGATEYPWGRKWPPASNTGNFADTGAIPHLRADHTIPQYNDDFTHTAPVGSFAPNALGLHDLAGNVQEWVSGEYGGPEHFHFRRYGVTRGGDYTSFRPGQLSSHSRTPHPADSRRPTIGFRLVLERQLQHP
ncbi:MAG: SUMF1/EgtB/PvdO family nonheme iron enzyme [Akkermansia sp.]|nr:SUMF1/EgtB/PvdO family nonheme iron enzyme [Akkermansia sp.]